MHTASEKNLFLAGGSDLEMKAIIELLESVGYIRVSENNYLKENKGYADKKLSWGAGVKDYEEFFDFPGVIYGIELSEPPGWKAPANYHRIDHHNELAHLPSSIEQIAELLNIDLTKKQQLIAANDKGYIPAMKEIGATEEEIREIRLADRKAQGVTDEDEKLAEESISNNLEWNNNVALIRSLTDKFSPVTDRMYGKSEKLLVYTDEKLVYYGKGVGKIKSIFEKQIEDGRAYSGGGQSGYFGTVPGSFSQKELTSFKERIISELNTL